MNLKVIQGHLNNLTLFTEGVTQLWKYAELKPINRTNSGTPAFVSTVVKSKILGELV